MKRIAFPAEQSFTAPETEQALGSVRRRGEPHAVVGPAGGQLEAGQRRQIQSCRHGDTAHLDPQPAGSALVLYPEAQHVGRGQEAAALPDGTNAIVLADFSGAAATNWSRSSAEGVSFTVSAPRDDAGVAAGVLIATNAGRLARNAAWARLEKRFDPSLNLKDRQALGVWIEGDDLGEVLAIRLESPRHIALGAVADRYLTVDFSGRRFFTLVETESARWSDFVWNDGKGLYNVYRETIDFGVVESASVWLQNLPPGREARCRIGPIRALPMLAATIRNPALTVNGQSVELAVEMTSGNWIECDGLDDCTVYGLRGETLAKVRLSAPLPSLRAGSNEVRFSCASGSRPAPRVKVTLFTLGEER